MGDDEGALLRLWREKRGEARTGGPVRQPHRPTGLGDRGPQSALVRGQCRAGHHGRPAAGPASRSGGWRPPSTAGSRQRRGVRSEVHAAVVVLGGSGGGKIQPQLQHNMWVVAARSAVLSVITGGGKWVEIKTHADPLYQHLIVTAERKFWRCVETGEPRSPVRYRPPKPRIEAGALSISAHPMLGGVAVTFAGTTSRPISARKSQGQTEELVPKDAQQAVGHGVCARRLEIRRY